MCGELPYPTLLGSTMCQGQTKMRLASYQTHCPWAWQSVELKLIWGCWVTRPNTLGSGCVPSLAGRRSGELRDPTLLRLATCQAQTDMSLTRCQNQHPWAWLHTEPNQEWVWRITRLITLRFGCAPSLIGHELATFSTLRSWAWLRAKPK